MKNLTDKDARGVEIKVIGNQKSVQLDNYKKMISDEDYLNDAIDKIATDLSHYLTK